jgi:MFS family permease
VIPIYGTTLADTLGYTLMIPLLPTIVRMYHASPAMAGALLSIPALFSAIAAPVWGKVSDRVGRKSVILVAQGLSLLGYLLLALAHSLALIFASRIVSGLGGGSMGAVESYIADATEEKQREAAYSIYGAVFGLAFIVGPAISGALIRHGISWPFFLAALLEGINIGFTALFLPFRKKPEPEQRSDVAASFRAAMAPGVRRVIVRHFLFIFAIVAFLANFSLFVEKRLHSSIENTAYLLAAAGIVGGLSILAVAPLAKRIGDVRLAQTGLLLNVAAYGGLIFVSHGWPFAVTLVIWAIGAALVEPTLTALLSDRAKTQERGAIMGMSDSINSVAMILGPPIGGAVLGESPRLLGVLSGAAAIAAFLLGHVNEKKTRAKESCDGSSTA